MSLRDYLAARADRCPVCLNHPPTQGHGPECSAIAPTDDKAAAYVEFKRILAAVADDDGLIRMKDMRPRTQHIFHKWRSSFYPKAEAEGFITAVERRPSTDTKGGNAHHDERLFRLRGAA